MQCLPFRIHSESNIDRATSRNMKLQLLSLSGAARYAVEGGCKSHIGTIKIKKASATFLGCSIFIVLYKIKNGVFFESVNGYQGCQGCTFNNAFSKFVVWLF